MRSNILLAVAVAACLGACDRSGRSDGGASLVINVSGDDGVAIKAGKDADGDHAGIAGSAPGFDAKLRLPGLKLSAGDMDFNGMKMFPGSTIGGMNISAGSGDGGQVTIAFSTPAAPAQVLAYYRDAAPKAGYALTAAAPSHVRATRKADDGKDELIDVGAAAAPSGGTTGNLVVTGK